MQTQWKNANQQQPDTFDLNPFAAMSASDSHNSDFWYYVRRAENAGERVSTAVTFSCIFGLGKVEGLGAVRPACCIQLPLPCSYTHAHKESRVWIRVEEKALQHFVGPSSDLDQPNLSSTDAACVCAAALPRVCINFPHDTLPATP